MTTPSFIKLIEELSIAVDQTNIELIDNVTNEDMDYKLACIKPNITNEWYFTTLKKSWEDIVGKHMNNNDKCTSAVSKIISVIQSSNLSAIDLKDLNESKIEEIIIDNLVDKVLLPNKKSKFNVDIDLTNTLLSLISVLKDGFFCQIFDIYIYIMDKYGDKLKGKVLNLDRDKIKKKIMQEFSMLKQALLNTNKNVLVGGKIALENELVNHLTGIYNFSVENELNRLIPEELGSLKKFFVTIISKYYENLHPIIWAQIVKNMINNIFIEAPSTPDEMFQFMSKYLLLNSGPFILKILQMIKPVLTPDLIKKYNLAKLTYPLMSLSEVDLILSKIVPQWDLYKIVVSKSASVGHVCIVYRVDNPSKLLVIKIIKPISIVQSCWEYKTLYNIFKDDKCSTEFVRNMLESNGRELNVANEITNLNDGHKYYTDTYKSVFNKNIQAKLTTIQAIDNIPKAGTWFALGMTLAPGIPLGDLIEADLLKNDTIFRAKIHRCLDLTVYKFFNVLISKGFYHGDPHAGNIFFSFEDSQMTLIDFGAIGHIDLFSNDPSIKVLLEIIIMSTFNNYDEILDKMTDLVNSKCDDILIDKNSESYVEFNAMLVKIKKTNIINNEIDKKIFKENKSTLFSEKRITNEQNYTIENNNNPHIQVKSIYSLLEYENKKRESVMFNTDIIKQDQSMQVAEPTNPSVSFSTILEKMIGFYALSGTNIAIKFSEFYELQKAYALLLGVLAKTNYSSYRIKIMIEKAIIDFKNVGPVLSHLGTTIDLAKIYFREKNIYNEYKKNIDVDTNATFYNKNTDTLNKQPVTSDDVSKNNVYYSQIKQLKNTIKNLSDRQDIENVKKDLIDKVNRLELDNKIFQSAKKYANLSYNKIKNTNLDKFSDRIQNTDDWRKSLNLPKVNFDYMKGGLF